MDSKGPFYVFAVMLLGNLAFLLVEVLEWPRFLLLACRVLMSLGFGAGFAAKRRAGLEPNVRRREYLFMLFELSASVGMASGPLLTGFLALAWPRPPSSRRCRCRSAARSSSSPCAGARSRRSHLHARRRRRRRRAAARRAGGAAGRPRALRGDAARDGREVGAGGDPADPAVAAAATAAAAAAVGVVTVQSVCLLGIGRNFLKFGFESAMVVVYDRQLGFSEGRPASPAACALVDRLDLRVQGVCVSASDGDAAPHRRAISDHVGALRDRHRRHAAQRRRRRYWRRTKPRRRASPRAPTSSPPPRTGTPTPRTART